MNRLFPPLMHVYVHRYKLGKRAYLRDPSSSSDVAHFLELELNGETIEDQLEEIEHWLIGIGCQEIAHLPIYSTITEIKGSGGFDDFDEVEVPIVGFSCTTPDNLCRLRK